MKLSDERIKQFMENVGLPNSQPLYQTIIQIEHEVETETKKEIANQILLNLNNFIKLQ